MPSSLKAMLQETLQANKRMEEAWRSYQKELKAVEVVQTMEGTGSSHKRSSEEISQDTSNVDGYEEFDVDEFFPSDDQIIPTDAYFAGLPPDDAPAEVWMEYSKRAHGQIQKNDEERSKVKRGLSNLQKTAQGSKIGIKKMAKK